MPLGMPYGSASISPGFQPAPLTANLPDGIRRVDARGDRDRAREDVDPTAAILRCIRGVSAQRRRPKVVGGDPVAWLDGAAARAAGVEEPNIEVLDADA
ncbi:MAG TPA: hypothetical protein VHN80_01960 [Kineosporiaceae bacterium]|jgi:hypothetical protein|nr:hypothetical protein [Kineosporiaceae bacterium]